MSDVIGSPLRFLVGALNVMVAWSKPLASVTALILVTESGAVGNGPRRSWKLSIATKYEPFSETAWKPKL